MKKCPYCAEEIQDEAIKCKHCGEMLAAAAQPPPAPPMPVSVTKKPGEAIGMILVMIPVVSAILTWFWIGNMRLIDGPGAKLGGLAALTVLITAALAAFEASELGFGNDKTRPKLERVSPLGWFFSMVLLWIFEYPRYLYVRSRYGVRNLEPFGFLSMILWLVPLCIVGYHIATAESEMGQQIQQLYR